MLLFSPRWQWFVKNFSRCLLCLASHLISDLCFCSMSDFCEGGELFGNGMLNSNDSALNKIHCSSTVFILYCKIKMFSDRNYHIQRRLTQTHLSLSTLVQNTCLFHEWMDKEKNRQPKSLHQNTALLTANSDSLICCYTAHILLIPSPELPSP